MGLYPSSARVPGCFFNSYLWSPFYIPVSMLSRTQQMNKVDRDLALKEFTVCWDKLILVNLNFIFCKIKIIPIKFLVRALIGKYV